MRAVTSPPDIPGRYWRGVAIASTLLSAATAGVYWRVRSRNPYQPVLEKLTLPVAEVHRSLAGLRIGFVSDVHAGPFIDRDSIQTACSLLERESPHLILFGGDYVSESPRFLESSMPVLGGLAAAAPLGAYAVLGNHDIFVSASQVTAALEAAGIAVLRNEARPVGWQESTFWIVGIDDSLHGRPDVDKAFSQVHKGDPSLALWHEPQFAGETAARGAMAQLSGHTHGGQVRLPGIRPIWLPQHGRRYVTGLHNVMGMPVYTSRGVGVYRPPVRLNCPPEVTLISFDVNEDQSSSAKPD